MWCLFKLKAPSRINVLLLLFLNQVFPPPHAVMREGGTIASLAALLAPHAVDQTTERACRSSVEPLQRTRKGWPASVNVRYQIRDMERDTRQKCLDMMQETFLRDEPLCDVLGITKDPVSINTIRANWEGFVSQNMSLACFTEVDGQPDQLVGFNITLVKSKDDEEEDFDKVQGESWKKLLRTLITAEETFDVFQHYNVDKYLTSSGLTVLPEFRGQNIGAKLFAAREPLCKALGIEATATVFTAKASQVLAEKCGYEVLSELNYSDMMKYGIDLSKCPTPSAKLMGTKFK